MKRPINPAAIRAPFAQYSHAVEVPAGRMLFASGQLGVAPDDKVVIRKLPEVEFLSRERQVIAGAVPVWFSLESSAGFLDRTQPDFQTRGFSHIDRCIEYVDARITNDTTSSRNDVRDAAA